MRTRKYFTLIEMIWVLALIALILGTATGSFYLAYRYRLEMIVRKLSGDLSWAREQAVNRSVRLVSDLSAVNNSNIAYYAVQFCLTDKAYGIYSVNTVSGSEVWTQLKYDNLNVNSISVTDSTGSSIEFTYVDGKKYARFHLIPPLGTLRDNNNNKFLPSNRLTITVQYASMPAHQIIIYGDTGFIKTNY